MAEHTGCDHPLEEHQRVRMDDLDVEGGLVVCRQDCPCVDTWAVEGATPPDYGDDLPLLRAMVWEMAAVERQLERLRRREHP
ncbi:hypothetical protein SAMN04488543_4196 [Friedmanniella luteola]|uniref:Uncharacterized protein n=1 Tax=Friedmanniella luteola TaxID=546871 RepID=A0A1H2A3S2_9ACTN|nr:hypothetical protein [Friedmanniella luteola]SDT40569.1 hypothetical protein SAMN04488543_4196 [Friedmanniella luteola]